MISQYEEAGQGVSKARVLMNDDGTPIDDKYNNLQNTDRVDAMSKKSEDKRSLETVKREEFLSIVKSSDNGMPD
jgi:hypothetical protein